VWARTGRITSQIVMLSCFRVTLIVTTIMSCLQYYLIFRPVAAAYVESA
jgi:hypothetical protein